MAKNFHFEAQKKPTSRGQFPVYIRITENRVHKRIKTTIALSKYSDWNPSPKDGKSYVRKTEPHSEVWNSVLDKEMEDVRNLHRDNKTLSLESLASSYKNKDKSDSFLDFAKGKVEVSSSTQSIGTHKHYLSTIQKLEAYLETKGMKDVSFSEVDYAFLEGFEAFLGKVENQRTAGRTLEKITMQNYLKKFRKLVFDAVKMGLIPADKNPFIQYHMIKAEDTTKEKLEQDELDRIMALELPEGSDEWHTRNCFLFSFYCAGIRAGDVLQLRWKNVEGGRLIYRAGKTGKGGNIELVEGARAILELYHHDDSKESDYIFPFLDSGAVWAIESYKNPDTMPEGLKKKLFNQIASKNVLLNRHLKTIALKARVRKNLSMHVARHTFAHLAMKNNLSSSVTKVLLQHSSLAVTEKYMGNFSNDEVDRALEQMFVKDAQNGANKALQTALNSVDKKTLVNALMGLINQLNQ